MQTIENESVENKFLLLSVEEKASIISHGVALRFSEWKKRLFLAESKVRFFEEKYNIAIAELDAKGLPDDAEYEMHEDYIQWQHWIDAGEKAKQMVKSLKIIDSYGVQLPHSFKFYNLSPQKFNLLPHNKLVQRLSIPNLVSFL